MQHINRTALILGASGLVGRYCLEYLLKNYSQVTALVRRPLPIQHEKLIQNIIDFDDLEKYHEAIKGQDVFCCIGTTVLKSPNKKDYYRIDFTYPKTIAEIALSNGAEQFLLVSALSANSKSLFYYSRVKGQLEDALIQLRYKGLHIFQPSFLIGKRPEFRPIEKIGVFTLKCLSSLLIHRLAQFKPIEAKTVASVMVHTAQQEKMGIHKYRSDEVQSTYDTLLLSIINN